MAFMLTSSKPISQTLAITGSPTSSNSKVVSSAVERHQSAFEDDVDGPHDEILPRLVTNTHARHPRTPGETLDPDMNARTPLPTMTPMTKATTNPETGNDSIEPLALRAS